MTTYSSLFFHLIWSTKERVPLISDLIENKLHAYMVGTVQGKGGNVIQIGGMPDHVHLLVRLKPDQSLPELVKVIKYSSGKWMRDVAPAFSKFSWQTGYGTFSVSRSQTDVVQQYIKNQKEHHKVRGFAEEFEVILKNHNVEYKNEYLLG